MPTLLQLDQHYAVKLSALIAGAHDIALMQLPVVGLPDSHCSSLDGHLHSLCSGVPACAWPLVSALKLVPQFTTLPPQCHALTDQSLKLPNKLRPQQRPTLFTDGQSISTTCVQPTFGRCCWDQSHPRVCLSLDQSLPIHLGAMNSVTFTTTCTPHEDNNTERQRLLLKAYCFFYKKNSQHICLHQAGGFYGCQIGLTQPLPGLGFRMGLETLNPNPQSVDHILALLCSGARCVTCITHLLLCDPADAVHIDKSFMFKISFCSL